MLLDMWVVLAAGLALVIAVALVALLGWRARALTRVRAELDTRCKAAQAALEEGKKVLESRATARDWKQELTTHLAALDAQAAGAAEVDPTLTIRREVLRSEISGKALDLSTHLQQPSSEDGGSLTELHTLKAAHAALEAELATLRAEREAAPDANGGTAPVNLERERELKALVQQFTRDSREMLSCIQSLESENRELRSTMSGKAKSAA